MKSHSIQQLADQLAHQYLSNSHSAIGSPSDLTSMINSVVLEALSSQQLQRLKSSPLALEKEIKSILLDALEVDASFRRSVSQSFKRTPLNTSDLELFISYKRKVSQDFVRHLAERLNRYKNVTARFDEEQLKPGPFPEQLGHLIRNCNVFLLIIEHGTLEGLDDTDNWVRREIVTALASNKKILPIAVDADGVFDSFTWPKQLESIGYLQAMIFKKSYFDASEKKLLKAITSIATTSI